MVRLADITPGCRLIGLISGQAVSVVSVEPYSDISANITYRLSSGAIEGRVFFAEDVEGLSVEESPWGFTANGDDFKLASEALRISLASTQDPFLAVRTSRIRPLPHQISAVYEKMLPRLPLRYVLADDPGAGKTVMAGLLVKEMMARGDLKRCLVVCPGSLCVQWQDELLDKFGLDFAILTRDAFEASGRRNAFLDHDLAIASLDRLARDKEIGSLVEDCQWDLVIFDEAHKLAAHVYGREVKYTARYRLAQLLSGHTENLLLMTATPHNGKPKDFQQFMALVDADRFEGAAHGEPDIADVSDVMRRLVKRSSSPSRAGRSFPSASPTR
ncbi:DEAD/DEAH box helicase [Granulimonas faecalis]|uniref:DEAD/DEAH box helicase n=1 Tax=Granulimonas faecalis TaxID=2894155 RepID=UPI00351849DE